MDKLTVEQRIAILDKKVDLFELKLRLDMCYLSSRIIMDIPILEMISRSVRFDIATKKILIAMAHVRSSPELRNVSCSLLNYKL